MLRAKEGVALVNEFQSIALTADYVIKQSDGSKEILTGNASVRFTTGSGLAGDTNNDGVLNLIDLSNMVDWFGIRSTHADWESKYVFFDFNNNGEIDISDIAFVARLI